MKSQAGRHGEQEPQGGSNFSGALSLKSGQSQVGYVAVAAPTFLKKTVYKFKTSVLDRSSQKA